MYTQAPWKCSSLFSHSHESGNPWAVESATLLESLIKGLQDDGF